MKAARISPGLHILILAAGAGRRFGGAKQVATIGGTSLIRSRCQEALKCAVGSVNVVIGAHRGLVLREIPAGVRVIENPDWSQGQSTSVGRGIAVITAAESAHLDAILVLLADQAALTSRQLQRLINLWQQTTEKIVCARYSGINGVPAIFPPWCFPRLNALVGDHGARAILRDQRHEVVSVVLPEAALDIDTPEDLYN